MSIIHMNSDLPNGIINILQININPMMWGPYGNGFFGIFSLIGFFTWIALLVFLVLGSIYFWKEINRKK